MDRNTKFLLVVSIALMIVTLAFTIYVANKEVIINTDTEDKVKLDVSDSINETKDDLASTVTEHKSAEEEINNLLEENKTDDTGVAYRVTLIGDWNKLKNPDWHVDGSHFAPFVVWSYYNTIADPVYQEFTEASEGMEIMAETGAITKLKEELENEIDKGTVFDYASGDLIFTPDTTNAILHLDENNSIASVVSMLAPSPDWFIAVRTNLHKNNNWIEDVTIDALNFDAGTDSGKKFKSFNKDTDPKEKIIPLEDASEIPIASFRFERIK